MYEVAAHQTDPTRNSVFYNAALNKKYPYLRTAGLANAKAQILEIANIPETFELITTRRSSSPRRSSGSATAAEACKNANDKWVTVLKRGGHLK